MEAYGENYCQGPRASQDLVIRQLDHYFKLAPKPGVVLGGATSVQSAMLHCCVSTAAQSRQT